MLPRALVPLCLQYFHEGLGHPWSKRTLASIMTKYYWKNISKDVADHCHRCHHCMRRKADKATRAQPPPQTGETPSRPMQIVHVDLITDMPKTTMGNTIISVCVCAMTGWLTIQAHAARDAETIAKHLIEDFFYKYGYPEVMKTDNGGEFRNGTMRAIQHLLHIRSALTTPYNSQANGKVEKRNSTIYDILSTFCSSNEGNQRRWDEFLPVVSWAYNTTVNNATGFTPFRAMFGREARLPHDSWMEDFATTYNIDINDYVTKTTDALRTIWDAIANRSTENHERVVAQYEAKNKRAFTPFRIGEQFYYKMMPRRNFLCADDEKRYKLSGKLQYRYTGPHTVTSVINPVTYIASFDGFHRTVHANRMKRDSRRNASRRAIEKTRRRKAQTTPNKPPYGPIHWTHDTAPTAPVDLPVLLTNLTNMHTDEPTKAYGVYAEDILANNNQLPVNGHMTWGRTTIRRHGPQQDITTPTMSIIPRHYVFRLPRPQRIVRTHQSWAQHDPSISAPCELLGVGCLWDASSPDDGPFNGRFHRTDEFCRRCAPSKC